MLQSTRHVDLILAEAEARDRDHTAVIATDILGTILYWNAGAESLYGWARHEVVGRNIIDVIQTHSSADDAARIMEQLQRGKPWSGSFIVRTRAGDPMLTHVVDEPIQCDGVVVGVIGLSRQEHPRRPRDGSSVGEMA